MSTPVLELTDVGKCYLVGPPWARRPVHALLPLSLQLGSGEMLAVVGESGSGKTTLARLCLGLTTPSEGLLAFSGAPVLGQSRKLRGRLAAVLQNPSASLDPRLRIGRSIAEPMFLAGMSQQVDRRTRVLELLDRVGLARDFAERFPQELSGGQRQRVTIARALATTPELIVFDEAVSALDVSVQAQVLNLIVDLQREIGFAGLFITHDLAVARYVADRVLVLRHGAVEALLPAHSLYDASPVDYVRDLQISSGLL